MQKTIMCICPYKHENSIVWHFHMVLFKWMKNQEGHCWYLSKDISEGGYALMFLFGCLARTSIGRSIRKRTKKNCSLSCERKLRKRLIFSISIIYCWINFRNKLSYGWRWSASQGFTRKPKCWVTPTPYQSIKPTLSLSCTYRNVQVCF